MSYEQAAALLFGLALGDALGADTEFMKLPQIKQQYGPRGIQEPPDPALYTDDTQMTLALAEGLLDAGLSASLDQQMTAIGKRYIGWLHSPENNRAPGMTCISGVQRFENGISWHESGIAGSKGCGSAMRVASIGYFYQRDERRLREIAKASSLITHGHPAAIAASVGAAYAVKLALDDVPVADYLRLISEFTDDMSDEFAQALRRVAHVAAWTDEEAAMAHIGQGWVAEEAVALALYCVIRYPNDYTACVRRAANGDGDTDSVACIAGSIMGARLGLDAIPADWRARCEHRDQIDDLARRMAQARDETVT
jgi:ADP-ribosylglycohydrolase